MNISISIDKRIYLYEFVDHGKKYLRIKFMYDVQTYQLLISLKVIRWDRQDRFYYMENNFDNLKLLESIFKDIAKINYHKEVILSENTIIEIPVIDKIECPEEFIEKLKLKRYSENTIKTYKYMFCNFINFFPSMNIDDISENDIKTYQLHLVRVKNVSESYQNQSINAIKFYYEKVRYGNKKIYTLERPRKSYKLPNVLSEEEIKNIFRQVVNLKHKCILYAIYSGGLRISEAVNLKVSDIDSKRKLIFIRGGKGKKDRVTLLSDKLLILLRDYYKEYKPKEWLFEGQNIDQQYSVRSIDKILKINAKKAEITKNVTVHSLRHSFATHLLERGTDLRYIQSLLGHTSSKTTEIYTHITKKGIDKIKSPFDYMDI